MPGRAREAVAAERPEGHSRSLFPEQSARRIGELTRRAADTWTLTSGGRRLLRIGGNRRWPVSLGTFFGTGGSFGRSIWFPLPLSGGGGRRGVFREERAQ